MKLSSRARGLIVVLVLAGLGALVLRSSGGGSPKPGANDGSSLKKYTTCVPRGGIEIVSVDRLSGEGTRHRSVKTPEGPKLVSMIDGYRVAFAYRHENAFANLSAETSPESSYAQDKIAVIAELKVRGRGATVATKRLGGYEVFSIDQPSLDAPSPLGVYVLFNDATHTIVTIYFLNQSPDLRHFQTIEQYRALRDEFLQGYVDCVEGK